MNIRRTRHLVLTAVVIAALLFDFFWVDKANQTLAKSWLDESIALSAATYATCRIINGGVSSIQESSISISPWGVGIEFEAGQILDPINDATERLSDACVKSMALLGVQRLLLTAVNKYTMMPFYFFALLFGLILFFTNSERFLLFLCKGMILFFLIRMAIPAMCYVGTRVNENYFTPTVNSHKDRLAQVKQIAMEEFKTDIYLVTQEHPQNERSLFKKVSEWSAAAKHRAASIVAAISYMKDNFNEISESLAALFVTVIEKIILQVFILPLSVLYGLKKGFACLTDNLLLKSFLFTADR